MKTLFINLTQHTFTNEQRVEIADCEVVDTCDEVKRTITFDEVPTRHIIAERMAQLRVYIANIKGDHTGTAFALVGGAPFFQQAVNTVCREMGVVPVCAFSKRESVESTDPETGAVIKRNVFKHVAFIEADIA